MSDGKEYARLLPYAFRRFSVLKGLSTGIPTLEYYIKREALPASEKPALFTMNILPPMMTVWHHLAKKNLGDAVDISVFDCSGGLDAQEFPGTRVHKFLNFYAATKSDEFLYHIAKNRRIGWICDDDVFFLSPNVLAVLQKEMSVPNTASVSFRPREWWDFRMNDRLVPVSGSYCIAFDRTIVCDKEHLSLRPAEGNIHPARNGKGERRYDTGDKMNEILLERGYRCAIVPEVEREQCIAAFSGLSGAVMLLYYFKKPDDVLNYFRSPPEKQWGGALLFGVLSAMLAVCTIQELYTKLQGRPYALPSLPSRSELEKIRRERTPFIGEERSFKWIDDVSDKLWKAL